MKHIFIRRIRNNNRDTVSYHATMSSACRILTPENGWNLHPDFVSDVSYAHYQDVFGKNAWITREDVSE